MAEAPTPGGTDTLRTRLEFEYADVDDVALDGLVGNILKGNADGQFDVILEALAMRAKATDTGIRWAVDLPDLQATQDELTLRDARTIQSLAKRSWLVIDPVNDVTMTIAVLTALYVSRNGETLVDAAQRVEAMSAVNVAQAISQYSVSLPFDGAQTE